MSYTKKQIKELLSDLYNVGKTKIVGYLPNDTLIDLCNHSQEEVKAWAEKEGLKYVAFPYSTWVYHREKLHTFLKKHKKIFVEASLPTGPQAFIKHLANEVVLHSKHPKAYILIGVLFNDTRFNEEDIDNNRFNFKSKDWWHK